MKSTNYDTCAICVDLSYLKDKTLRMDGRKGNPILYGHFPPSDSERVVVSYKRKYVHKVLVNPLVKLAQEIAGEIACLGQLTVST